MLDILLAIPVSVALLVWILRMKRWNPFPKFTFVKLLIAGAVALTLSGIITLIGGLVVLLAQIGPEQIAQMKDAESAVTIIQEIGKAAKAVTPDAIIFGFIRTFVLVGLVEEILKFAGAKIVMKKEGVAPTWMDAVLCFAIVGISFQLIEDVQYSSGNIGVAIFRALTPFHFTFAVIMGYLYGLGKVRGNKTYTLAAIFYPAFIHAMYDFSINLLQRSDVFIFFNLAMNAAMFILTVVMILKLRKWHKEGTLDVYI